MAAIQNQTPSKPRDAHSCNIISSSVSLTLTRWWSRWRVKCIMLRTSVDIVSRGIGGASGTLLIAIMLPGHFCLSVSIVAIPIYPSHRFLTSRRFDSFSVGSSLGSSTGATSETRCECSAIVSIGDHASVADGRKSKGESRLTRRAPQNQRATARSLHRNMRSQRCFYLYTPTGYPSH